MLGSTTRGAEPALQPETDDRPVEALEAVLPAVDALLDDFLDARVRELAELDAALVPVGSAVANLVASGGKRLRPAFVYWGHRATGADHHGGVIGPAAAVQLLHTFALIHDDIMDRSEVRRGRPAAHVALAATHAAEELVGDAGWFGVGGAILAGDLAFVWADQLLDEACLPVAAIDRARRVFTALRVEVMAGQYLDLRLSGMDGASEQDSLRVALLKSGRYTVTRPLQLGAAIAGADPVLERTLAAYGDAVGLAFQLRDDVLGLFGDPDATGKSAVEDLREGKRTLLVLRAMELASPAERGVLAALLGKRDLDPDDADRARQIVAECGALDAVESLLVSQQEAARQTLVGVTEPARSALEELAGLAAFRAV
ncbi:MAG: polyprenyl synthetase family protein [Egibacteraceae bacterium]